MGLQPLEFSECLLDSPYFRQKLENHEKELDRTNKFLKTLIDRCTSAFQAARNLSKAQKSVAEHLINFKFECIGTDQTEDEKIIEQSLTRFGELIVSVEEQRETMLQNANASVIEPLETFRRFLIEAKNEKKKFITDTKRFCQYQEKYLKIKPQEASREEDVKFDEEQKTFNDASMMYVLRLQEVQERKKFEFVEDLLLYISQWMTFYHDGYDKAEDFNSTYKTELQKKLQKCRDNYEVTKSLAEQLKKDTLVKQPEAYNTPDNKIREGYLFMLEKKQITLTGTTWNKIFCSYSKPNRLLSILPYTQSHKGPAFQNNETYTLLSCVRRAKDSIDRRFCFDITLKEKQNTILTLQALTERDLRLWMQAMDGEEPIYSEPKSEQEEPKYALDEVGFEFVKLCIATIEARGLDEEGLYRLSGVASKVTRLTTIGLDREKKEKLDLSDQDKWETKTITSALKSYLRYLPQPLLTFTLHRELVAAAKTEPPPQRVDAIKQRIYQLPRFNYELLKILIDHLRKVAERCDKNLMTVSNLSVCLAPTLMQPKTMSEIFLDMKWCNVVVETLINNYHTIFLQMSAPPAPPPPAESGDVPVPYTVHKALQYSPGGYPVHPPTDPQPSRDVPIYSNAGRGHQRVFSDPHTSSPGAQELPNSVQQPVVRRNPRQGFMSNSTDMSNNDGAARSRDGVVGESCVALPPNLRFFGEETFKQAREKRIPSTGLYKHYSPTADVSSRSSSAESLTSKGSSQQQHSGSPLARHHNPLPQALAADTNSRVGTPPPGNVRQAIKYFSGVPSGVRAPPTANLATSALQTSVGPLYSNQQPLPSVPPTISPPSSQTRLSMNSLKLSTQSDDEGRRVMTLYPCRGENETELSFEANQEITHVHYSKEPGWLFGYLNGKRGLIPANYVQFCD